jgi:hypothetical protein
VVGDLTCFPGTRQYGEGSGRREEDIPRIASSASPPTSTALTGKELVLNPLANFLPSSALPGPASLSTSRRTVAEKTTSGERNDDSCPP